MGLFAGGVSLRSPQASIAAWTSVLRCSPRPPNAPTPRPSGHPRPTMWSTSAAAAAASRAGDYMVHCHVAHHYLAGMWTIWRVYNTKQDVSLPGRPAAPGRAAGPGWPDAHGRDLSRAGGPHRGLEGDKSSRSPRRTWERGWNGSYRPGEFLEATTPRCWTGSERVTLPE